MYAYLYFDSSVSLKVIFSFKSDIIYFCSEIFKINLYMIDLTLYKNKELINNIWRRFVYLSDKIPDSTADVKYPAIKTDFDRETSHALPHTRFHYKYT